MPGRRLLESETAPLKSRGIREESPNLWTQSKVATNGTPALMVLCSHSVLSTGPYPARFGNCDHQITNRTVWYRTG